MPGEAVTPPNRKLMSTSSSTEQTQTRPSDAPALLALLAIAAVSFWPNRTIAADNLLSDTADYVLPAINFLRGKGMVIFAAGHKFPPNHVFGFSLLLCPMYELLGFYPGNGVYAVFALALACVALTYWIGRKLFGQETGVLASLFLAVSCGFRQNVQMIAPDAISAFFCLSAHALLIKIFENRQRSIWLWFLLGQSLGFALTLRPDNILFLLPVTAYLLMQFNRRKIGSAGAAVLAGGVAFWGVAILVTNYLYTGDFFRTTYHVWQSALHDRPLGSESWRYLLLPSFRESNLATILRTSLSQWNGDAGDDRVIQWFFWGLDLLFVIGLVKIVRASTRNSTARGFLLWIAPLICSLALLFSCSLIIFGNRHMVRVIPYLSLVDAVGFVELWQCFPKVGRLLESLRQRGSPRTSTKLSLPHLLTRARLLLLPPMAIVFVYLIAHPQTDLLAYVPTTAYLTHVRSLIPETNAVFISNFNPFYVEHILVDGTDAETVPLHRYVYGADYYVQWKKPPHPEWIAEDFPTRNHITRYRRMYDNGAQDLFPFTARENPEFIQQALSAGRSVYFLTPGVTTYGDFAAVDVLTNRFDVDMIEEGYQMPPGTPKFSASFATHFQLAKILSKPTAPSESH
jgi:hypothetical protein